MSAPSLTLGPAPASPFSLASNVRAPDFLMLLTSCRDSSSAARTVSTATASISVMVTSDWSRRTRGGMPLAAATALACASFWRQSPNNTLAARS